MRPRISSSVLRSFAPLLFVCGFATVAPVHAQEQSPPQTEAQRCQPPALKVTAREQNIFTAQQEMDLGDAVAEHLQRTIRVIDDPQLTAYLQRIGDRVVKNLPDSGIKFRFFIIELPDANAFALPGGRIYVSRKLIAFARTEDELASVLAHEAGHIVARDSAVEMTRWLREALNVRQVTTRQDIFTRYNQIIDSVATKPGVFRRSNRHGDSDQIDADQIGVYALARAGYDPQAFATFWDRYAETKGKKGGFFSDLFGTTSPESKRLREVVRALQTLPAECIAARTASAADDFQKWQTAVVSFTGTTRSDAATAMRGVLEQRQLDPPLRSDVTHVRFSPDGKHVIAQDDSGINILSREPFKLLFRIEAVEALPAQFTPDSSEIVFYTPNMRVERWSVADQKIRAAHEPFIRNRCLQSALAPDGKTLACFDPEFSLTLYDVATGTQAFQKKSFFTPTPNNFYQVFFMLLKSLIDETELTLVNMQFSPDARYFAAGHFEGALALEVGTRQTVNLRGQTKKMIGAGFTFVGSDRLLGINPSNQRESGLVSFPAGEVIDQMTLGGSLSAPHKGNFVILRPIKDYPVGVMDMATKKLFMAGREPAIDIYDTVYVAERRNGEVALYNIADQKVLQNIVLPRNRLGRVRAASLSPDFRWLAVSSLTRGAVWDLKTGERAFYLRGFRGAHFADNNVLYADFPKFEAVERNIAQLNLATKQAATGTQVADEGRTTQHGKFIVHMTPAKKEGRLDENTLMEVRDATTNQTMWKRAFPKESPRVWVDADEGTMMLVWSLQSNAAKAEIKNSPTLVQQLSAMREKEGDYFLQSLDASTGKVLGGLLVETGKGSFRLTNAFTAGDNVVVADSENRITIYQLSTGAQRGRVFGSNAAVAKETNLLCIENVGGKLEIYDLASMQKRDEFSFDTSVSLAQFSPDGKRLFVLTASQKVYVLDMTAKANNQTAASGSQ